MAKRRLELDLEEEIIRIPECDLTEVSERFKLTLIGRVLHNGGRSIEAMISLLPRARIWNVEGRARGTNLGNGRFQFDFDKEEDLNMVLNKRPCHINQWIFALERWEPFTSDNFSNTIPFWIKVTGVPVHFWNDKTFEEISKALGKKMTLDAKNARLQVSIDAEKPLQFNRRIGFPNGDIGRVSFEYEGLNRYCFACNRISHDVYSCSEISEKERERFVKELREQNAVASQIHQELAPPPNSRNNKRPRSPSGEAPKRSPTRYQYPGSSRGEKRSKESEYYWTAKRNEERFPREKDLRKGDHQDPVEKSFRRDSRNTSIWNCLEENESRDQRGTSRTGLNSSSQRNHRRPGNNRATNSREDRGNARSYNCSSPLSQQVWRSRSPTKETSKDPLEIPTTRYPPTTHENEPRSGVLIVHQNESSEERIRRLKGKAIETGNQENTPTSAAKGLTIPGQYGRGGTLVIRDVSQQAPQSNKYPLGPMITEKSDEDDG
ncbi:hypothetical protein Bca4012_077734 [Brassica carinata]